MSAEAFHALLFQAAVLLIAVALGVFLSRAAARRSCAAPRFLCALLFVLPFAGGGFATYTAPIVSALLLIWLCVRVRCGLRLRINLAAAAVLTLAAGFLLTPLWAADKGTAVFGSVRILPVLLFFLALAQLTGKEREGLFSLVPLSAAVMTVLSLALLPFAALQGYVSVGGRLSGFLEYPNTFALFLLMGYVLLLTKSKLRRLDLLLLAILVCGLLASGSRAGFALLLIASVVLFVQRRECRKPLAAVSGGCLVLCLGLSLSGLLPSAQRLMTLDFTQLFSRLLFYRDALPTILTHPFGLGYGGYRALLGSFQTAHYSVSFVHSGLLQLLFEVGWLPATLLTAAIIRGLFSGGYRTRLLLLVLSAHALFDFDLQYAFVWLLLLPLLDLESGREIILRRGRRVLLLASCAVVVCCCWLGAGDFSLRLGNPRLAAQITPFSTESQLALLQQSETVEEAAALAQSVLRQCPTNALALSAMANDAFSRGDMEQMISYKEQALACDRYALSGYTDYFRLLWTARALYRQAGDTDSAAYCAQLLQGLPARMEEVAAKPSPLAGLAGVSTALALPQAYLERLSELSQP